MSANDPFERGESESVRSKARLTSRTREHLSLVISVTPTLGDTWEDAPIAHGSGEASFLRMIQRQPKLTWEAERALARRANRGDRSAKQRLIEANLRLTVTVARRFRGQGVPLLDLVQEGFFGLVDAAERFDPRRGLRFSTYAMWWIRRSCQSAVEKQGRAIRLPYHVLQRRSQLARARMAFVAEHQCDPTLDELALLTGLSKQHVEEALHAAEASEAIDSDNDNGNIQSETIGVDECGDLSDIAVEVLTKAVLETALSRLHTRDRRLVELRFGLDGMPRTRRQVGLALGLTGERVRQLEPVVLERLQQLMLPTPTFSADITGLKPSAQGQLDDHWGPSIA